MSWRVDYIEVEERIAHGDRFVWQTRKARSEVSIHEGRKLANRYKRNPDVRRVVLHCSDGDHKWTETFKARFPKQRTEDRGAV